RRLHAEARLGPRDVDSANQPAIAVEHGMLTHGLRKGAVAEHPLDQALKHAVGETSCSVRPRKHPLEGARTARPGPRHPRQRLIDPRPAEAPPDATCEGLLDAIVGGDRAEITECPRHVRGWDVIATVMSTEASTDAPW